METTSISGAASQPTPSISQALGGTNATKEEFLKLLVTQLRNQDPLEPMKNEAFLSQLATFSQLEEQQQTSSAIRELIALQNASLVLGGLSQGASLVGKEITFVDPDGMGTSTGLVTEVNFDPSGVLLTVGGQTVPAQNVIGIALPGSGNGAGNTPAPEPPQAAPPPAAPPSAPPALNEPAVSEE